MRTNCDITIYSRTAHTETYTRSQVRGVFWDDHRAVVVGKNGTVESDRVTVTIPRARGAQTIKPGDVVVQGLVSDAIGPAFTVTALKAKYPKSMTVRACDPFLYGSLALQHYAVGGS